MTSSSGFDVVPLGHPARRASAGALVLTGVLAVAFTAFLLVSMRLPVGAPWQDDPYHGTGSFAEFLIPALFVVTGARTLLWRRGRSLPLYRLDQLVRAVAVALALIGVTLVPDWIAVAAHADRPLWNSATPWLIGWLAALSALTVAGLFAWSRARALLPAGNRRDGDWLDDLGLVVTRVVGAVEVRGAIGLLRRHVLAFAMALSAIGGLGLTAAQAIGEGWTDPLLIATTALAATGGLLAFCLICDAALHIAVPRTPQPIRPPRAALVAAGIGLPAGIVLRDAIWSLLGQHGVVDRVVDFAGIALGAGLAAGVLGLLLGFALLSRQTARAARPAG